MECQRSSKTRVIRIKTSFNLTKANVDWPLFFLTMKNLFLSGICICIPLAIFLPACSQKPDTLFQLLPSERTGVNFNNIIGENDTFNILTHEYIYNGGGVGIADFNNDGHQDIFFCGNLVPNRLYLNKGSFHFEDISAQAGVQIADRWSSGVAVADINNDGWMDMYVCATMHPDSANRRNMLFINNGLNERGIPTFSNLARDYNVEHD